MLTWTIGKYIAVVASIIGVVVAVFMLVVIIGAALVMYQRHKDKELYDTEGI